MRPRFTLRWLMVAVAIAGLACGWMELMGRRAHYLRLAGLHDRESRKPFILLAPYRILSGYSDSERAREADRKRSIWTRYHEALTAKYERAAHYPWLPVPPDPPEPE